MPREELMREIENGVCFWAFEDEHGLIGVMGIQDKRDVYSYSSCIREIEQKEPGDRDAFAALP
jgi:hypothetical protein